MAKSLCNFYLDDNEKKKCTEKLIRLCGEKNKGQFASFLRVCIRQFNDTPDELIDKSILRAIDREYEVTQTMNKRSCM